LGTGGVDTAEISTIARAAAVVGAEPGVRLRAVCHHFRGVHAEGVAALDAARARAAAERGEGAGRFW
jgi:hypothetical protein